MKRSRKLARLMIGVAALMHAAVAIAQEREISFPVVGDTGYIPAYEQLDDDEAPFRTLSDYLAADVEEWLDHNPDMKGFLPTPWVFETALGGYLPASGMYPVATAVSELCRSKGCDFAAMVGDNIYPDGATLGADGISDARRFSEMLDKPYGKLGAGVENFTIYAMMGNHDWHISREATMAQLKYLQAHPNFTMPGLFYSTKPKGFENDVEIFVIDTEMLLAGTTVYKDQLDEQGREVRTGELEAWDAFVKPRTPGERKMVDWLTNALATSTARWKIVLGHHALWSGGGSKFEKAHALRKLLMPALCQYADAYISGDDHMLEGYMDDCSAVANAAQKPLPLLVSGAGSKYRPLHPKFMENQLANNRNLKNLWSKGSVWGFLHVGLKQDVMTASFYSTPSDMSGRPLPETVMRFERRSK